MNTELLKKKILQLAMQGKLVEQDESDGTADELIDKIIEEKKQLMDEGKIKKEKLSRIYKNPTDNHYYEKFEDGKENPLKNLMLLPNKWQYIKMNDIIFYEQPSKYIVESTNYNDKYKTPVLTAGKSFILGYTNETKGIFSKVPTIIFDDFTTESKYVDFDFKVKSSAMKILNCSHLINIKFIYYLLQVINVDTSTHKRHWLSNYEYMIIPIPSKKVQDRIVAKIEELFKKVESINKHYNRINKLKELLKSKIIDMAIKGELTKQLPTDEPASKLIKNILEEKRKLMEEGKIKKENLSVIYKDSTDNQFYEKFDNGKIINITDKIPFDIPDTWCWVKIKDICLINPRNSLADELETSFIPMTLINSGYSNSYTFEIKKWKDIKKGFTHFKEGDIGIAKITPCFQNKKSTIFKKLKNGYGAGTTELHILRPITDDIETEYLFWIIKSSYFIDSGVKSYSGTVGQQRISKDFLFNFLVPVPNHNEQIKIINNINKVFNNI